MTGRAQPPRSSARSHSGPTAQSHSTLAQTLEAAGNGAAAKGERDRAERLRQEQAREQEASALTAAGVEQFGRGALPEALATFQKATAVLNSYAPAYYQMGRTLEALGHGPEARAAFARAEALNPSLRRKQNSP